MSIGARFRTILGVGKKKPVRKPGNHRSAADKSDHRPIKPASIPDVAPYWTSTRIDLVQQIWGPGYVAPPGGDSYIAELLEPLSLAPEMSVIDAAAGLGGLARYVAEELAVRVEGYEPSLELAAAGMRLSAEAELDAVASVRHYNPARVDFRKGVYDRLIARDLIRLVDDKSIFIRALSDTLKPGGQILLTDLVLGHSGAPGTSFKDWYQNEPAKTRPWTKSTLLAALEEVGLKTLSLEDNTDHLRDTIIESWSEYRSTLISTHLEHNIADELIEEGDRWARYVEALDGGDLRYCCVIAYRPN